MLVRLIEETKKYLGEGNAVAIFVNFTQSLKLLADELKQVVLYMVNKHWKK